MNWFINLINSVVFQTVISGLILFILSQMIQNFILEPLKSFKATIGKIDNLLKYHSNVIFSGQTLSAEIKIRSMDTIRDLSCELESKYKQIPFRDFFANIRLLPTKINISESARGLIFISNACARNEFIDKNFETVSKIRKNLNIPEI